MSKAEEAFIYLTTDNQSISLLFEKLTCMNLSSYIIYETICEVDRGKMAVHNFFRVTFSFFILASFSFHNIYHKLHNCLFYFHLPLTHVSDMSRNLFSSLPTPYPPSSSISYHGKWMYIYCLYLLYFSLLQFLLHTESSFFFLFFHLGFDSSSLHFTFLFLPLLRSHSPPLPLLPPSFLLL